MTVPDDPPDDIIDSDVDLGMPTQLAEIRPHEWDLLAAISAGGVIGALARYGVAEALPHRGDEFAWSTVLINFTGSALIGILMVVLLEQVHPHRLARPFLGVGILGGYTTYSTFALDTQRLLVAHRPLIALAYVLVTVLGCAAATTAAMAITRGFGQKTTTAGPA